MSDVTSEKQAVPAGPPTLEEQTSYPESNSESITIYKETHKQSKACDFCHKSKGTKLRQCTACKHVKYCTRECQKQDWRNHKKACVGLVIRNEPSTSRASRIINPPRIAYVSNPFQRLQAWTFLHDRPEQDVMELLIDSYRLELEDTLRYTGQIPTRSVYDEVNDNGLELFEEYLLRAEKRHTVLPPWWNEDSKKTCVKIALTSDFSNIAYIIDDAEIGTHYGIHMPLQLKLLAGQVCGRCWLDVEERSLVDVLSNYEGMKTSHTEYKVEEAERATVVADAEDKGEDIEMNDPDAEGKGKGKDVQMKNSDAEDKDKGKDMEMKNLDVKDVPDVIGR